MWPSSVLLTLVSAALVRGLTSPPPGALIVGPGHHATVQSAVDALNKNQQSEQVIFIHPGTYHEQVKIERLAGPLKVFGYSNNESSYTANQVTIVAGHSQKDKPSNDETATVHVKTANFKMYNVNVNNSFGRGSPAVALSAFESNQGYYACSFRGFQDTLLAQTGNQLYAKCYIEGATDFVFGQKAAAWFDRCTIGLLPTSVGFITANGRDSADSPSYYVFNRASLVTASNDTVAKGIYWLGRPWKSWSRVAFQFSYMCDDINPAGWRVWNKKGDHRNAHVSFGEYQNSGPGAMGRRAPFASKLSKPLALGDILGHNVTSEYYYDHSYMN
ncbi:hypothetical protein E4U41_001520 [Claviceps citrina]|nr:hypothetical protein E4U41_001520 [Claviceps citrina]